jgi:hypothetical protein
MKSNNDLKYDGYIKGLYSYFADNHNNIKNIFSYFFKINNDLIKIAFRREDLELMVLVKLNGISKDAVIIFTVNRLDEYRFNYDNDNLLINILDDFKVGSRCKKLNKIKERIDNDK